jgi:hypothetical protein
MALVFNVLLFASYFISGIGRDVINLTHLTAFTAIAAGFLILFKTRKKIKLPPHFGLYLLFTMILNIYILFLTDKRSPFNYSLLFTEGAAYWLLFYNLDKKYSEKLTGLFLALAIVYGILYGISLALNNSFTNLALHYFDFGVGAGHPQIGNFYALIVAFLAGSALSGKTYRFDLVFYLLGLIFIIFSKSRTTLIALGLSLMLYFRNSSKAKYFIYLAVPVIIIAILFISSGRSLLASRVYLLQSLLSVINYPLGVGMGNFREISLTFYNSGSLLGYYSSYTHNIFLEAISGVGIFALLLLLWGFRVLRDIFKNTKNINGWSYLFLTLTIIFMVDFFYIIPAMFWLWLSALGILQRSEV